MTILALCFFLSFFLSFLFPSILFLFFLCFLFAFVSVLSLFLFSYLPIFTSSPLLFLIYFHLFIFHYYYHYYYFLSSLFCLYSFTTCACWLGVLSLITYTVSAAWHSSTCSVVSSFWLHMGHFVSSSSLG